LKEPLLAFAAATGLAAALALLGSVVPIVRDYLYVPIAIIFFETPVAAARRAGRQLDYRDIGLRGDPIALNLAGIGVAVLITFPAFVAAFFVFYDRVCALPTLPLARAFAPICRHWLGYARGHLHAPPDLALLTLVQLVVVAIPEELFFRGYLMERLE